MDSQDCNSSDQYKRTQKVSYQTFLQEQKVKLKLRYPFLTKDQINKKAKDLWNHMGLNEKQFYTKTVLKRSPPSVRKSASKNPVKNPRQIKKVDSKKKWQGFRNLENEFEAGYENDFMSDSSKITLAKTVDEDLSWLTVENESDISTKNSKTFHKSRCQLNQKVPEIIQNTPHTPQGILKGRNGETSAEKSNQARVSFSSENFQADIDTYSDLTQNTFSQDSSDDEYSSKLLRRSENEVFNFDGESEQNTPNEKEVIKFSENPNESDKENKDNANKDVTLNQTEKKNKRNLRDKEDDEPLNLITLASNEANDKQTIPKSDLFSDDGEKSGSKSSADETNQIEFNSPRTRSKASKQSKTKTFKRPRLSKPGDKDSKDSDESSGSKQGKGIQEKDKTTFEFPSTRSKDSKSNKTNTFKKPKLSGTDDLKENIDLFSYSEEKAVSKTSEIQDSNENTFKSPYTRSRASKRSNMQLNNAKSFKSPGIRSIKVEPEQHATPITDINENINKYTTPLMDESVQQLILKDVEKAPKKKSHTQDNICRETMETLSEKQEIITKKKARTSLIGKNDLYLKSEAENGIMGPTGDATFCQDMIMKKLEEKMNNIENNDFSSDNNLNLVRKDCVKTCPESKNVLINRDKKNRRMESYLLKESSPFISDDYLDSVNENSNSEESQLSEELIKDSRRTNQALVKALLKMKQVVAGAASPEMTSLGSSPKLLSPALSGISQLSDMSSDSDNTKVVDPIKLTSNRDNINRMKSKETQQDANTATCSNMTIKNDITEGGILCQMFEENTSKNPQNIFYTRKRLISSYQSEGNNFTHMFSEDDPIL